MSTTLISLFMNGFENFDEDFCRLKFSHNLATKSNSCKARFVTSAFSSISDESELKTCESRGETRFVQLQAKTPYQNQLEDAFGDLNGIAVFR